MSIDVLFVLKLKVQTKTQKKTINKTGKNVDEILTILLMT